MREYIGYEKESPFPIIDGSHPKYPVLTDEEIVRCCDCKKCQLDHIGIDKVYFCLRFDALVDAGGFCSWGEKRCDG